MGITQRAAPKAAAPVATAEAQAANHVVHLELSLHNSYSIGGTRYEKGVCYAFTPEQAQAMLSRQSDSGVPLFRPYRSRTPVADPYTTRNADGVLVRDMSHTKVQPAVHVDAKGTEAKPVDPNAVIELASPEELAEIEALRANAESIEV